jgi:predicted alpha/beta-hydrolase family hydrolase
MRGPSAVSALAEPFRIELAPSQSVTALHYPAPVPHRAGITLILAHGAGANQASPFMVSFAEALAARGIDTVTFNFAYSEQGRRLPDRTSKLEACWRAVIETVRGRSRSRAGELAVGGKSMGGRIASQVAASGVDHLSGLVFLGYPLHPPGRPERLRAAHLSAVRAPMLFIQGSRDPFGTPEELRAAIGGLQPLAELYVVEGGDHSFKVLKSAGVRQQAVCEAIQDRVADWLRRGKSAPPASIGPRAATAQP